MKYLILILFFSISATIAQTDSSSSFELIGNLQYNYTNYSSPYGHYATSYSKSHTLILQPELGYFIVDQFEIFADLEYSLIISLWNSLESINSSYERPESQIDYDNLTHRIGFYFGTGYNFSISETTDLFFGTRIGIASSRRNMFSEGFQTIHTVGGSKRIEPVNTSYDSGWSDAVVSFPSFALALKLFPNPDLILILKIQYTKTNSYNGSPDNNIEELTFGIGLGTSFK